MRQRDASPLLSIAACVRLCATLTGVVVLLATSVAFGQTIASIQDIAVTRVHEADNRSPGRPYYYISREDCLLDDELTFDLDITGPNPQYTFQVWASDDAACTSQESRIGDDAVCWLVYQGSINSTSQDVTIRVQDIAARKLPQTTGGGVSVGDASDCDANYQSGIALYFMHVSAGSVQGGTPVEWKTQLDLQGPAAPTDVEAGIGDQRLVVTWDAARFGDGHGYRIYCERSSSGLDVLSNRYGQVKAAQNVGGGGGSAGGAASGGKGGTGEGGTQTTGGATAAGGTTPTGDTPTTPVTSSAGTSSTGGTSGLDVECDTNLIPGQLPPADAEVCGEVDAAASERGTASGLDNSVVYAVAVAAVDELNNPGPLSNVSCEAPEDLEEFFEAYRAAGGKGGGGFCDVAHGPVRPGGFLAWLTVGFLVAIAWRRRA